VTIPQADGEERALAGAAILCADYQRRVSTAVDLADIYDLTLRAVIVACAEHLADVDRMTVDSTVGDWDDLWPQTPPLTMHVRAGAASVLVDGATLVVLRGLLDEASVAIERDVRRVTEAAQARRRLAELEAERQELVEAWEWVA
jgi:hypothetical protein